MCGARDGVQGLHQVVPLLVLGREVPLLTPFFFSYDVPLASVPCDLCKQEGELAACWLAV